MDLLLVGAVAWLAFCNGANDNFKGFATVWGSGTLDYRKALVLATVATVAGGIASLFLAQALVRHFSGNGLVPDAVATAPAFLVSVGIAAAITVFAASRAGLPVSTTHALIGGLIGAGLGQQNSEIQLATLGNSFMLPLLASPLLAATLGWAAYRFLRLRKTQDDCACMALPRFVAAQPAFAGSAAPNTVAMRRSAVVIASDAQCEKFGERVSRVSISRLLDHVHTFSAALICFARGVNDTPKLAALVIAVPVFHGVWSVVLVAAVMAAGGIAYSRRVAETMSRRMVRLDTTQGLAANLITAGMVLFASQWGVPVSTTHVSVGSIAGAGVGACSIDWPVMRNIICAWMATLPLAVVLAWLASTALRSL